MEELLKLNRMALLLNNRNKIFVIIFSGSKYYKYIYFKFIKRYL